MHRLLQLLILVSLAFTKVAHGADARGLALFETRIAPLLKDRCLECHGGGKIKGDLDIATREGLLKGGAGGVAVVPSQASRSRLLKMLRHEEKPAMPDKGSRLAEAEIALIAEWIALGAPYAAPLVAGKAPPKDRSAVTAADQRHWAFQPLAAAGGGNVDAFVEAAQKARGLARAAPAEARVLVRRAWFDLVGLPPAPEEMTRWTQRIEASPSGFAELVDHLLASPRHGERWARHWLDIARYADSNGLEGDHDRPRAYHYRDFVIRSLNDDMPFDQFVRWQLAGDEIAPDEPAAIAATGFIVAGPSEVLNVPMQEEKMRLRANELDDMVSTTGQALLGLTLACSRCHDHKYDPLPSRDYYRLTRVFNSGDRGEVPLASRAEAARHKAALAKWKEELDAAAKTRDDWLNEARKPLIEKVRGTRVAKLALSDAEKQMLLRQPASEAAKKLAARFAKELATSDNDYIAALPANQLPRWQELDGKVKSLERRKPKALPAAFAFADFGPEPRETWFFERGDFLARREKMDLGFLSVLQRGKTAAGYWQSARSALLRHDSTQQRRALADWVTDSKHGAGVLLARVMVNRVWQHHFGEGLVRTVNDFGTRGEAPTHPELLEWLAGEFIRGGWSVKHMHRLIMTSATYQQASGPPQPGDPDNRWLTRRRPQRIESEILRDAMLSAAGTLNLQMHGPSFKPPIPEEAMQARNVKNPYPRDARDTPETRRRSVYMFHKRVVQHPLMQAFDAPDSQQSCGRRLNTIVAPQALALLNDPFVRQRARELATRLHSAAPASTQARVRLAFHLCLQRAPSPEEEADAGAFIASQTARSNAADAWTSFCQAIFGLNEFIYID